MFIYFIYLFILFIYLFIYLSIYLFFFIYLFIYLFIYFIYIYIYTLSHCSLGSTRFLKVAKCKSWEGLVVVKVFVIHDPSIQLTTHKKVIEEVSVKLSTAANCLQFHSLKVRMMMVTIFH